LPVKTQDPEHDFSFYFRNSYYCVQLKSKQGKSAFLMLLLK